MRKNLLIATLAFLALAACNNTPVIEVEKQGEDPLKENLINANKYIAQSEETSIESYIQRRGWKMDHLVEGAYVWECEKGNGKALDYEDKATIRYSLQTITGKTIYKDVTEEVTVGKHQPTVGLDQALMHLHYGSKAKVILPSNLGYGVAGDGDLVPSRAILVYELEIENNK